MLHEDYDDALGTFSRVLMKEPANSLARINVGYICSRRDLRRGDRAPVQAIRLDNDRKATLYAHFYWGWSISSGKCSRMPSRSSGKTLQLGPNLIEAYFRTGTCAVFAGERDHALGTWTEGQKANRFTAWSKRCAKCWSERPRARTFRGADFLKRVGGWAGWRVAALLGLLLPAYRATRPVVSGPLLLQVGNVTVVAAPDELTAATGLAEWADQPAEWPGLGRAPRRPSDCPHARCRRLKRLTGGRPCLGRRDHPAAARPSWPCGPMPTCRYAPT
jgi:hypothetical protein